jgi:hypothetical protein
MEFSPLSWLWKRNKSVRPSESNLYAEVLTYTPGKLFWPTSMLAEERRVC